MLQTQRFMLPTPANLPGAMPTDKSHLRKEADRLATIRIEALDSARRRYQTEATTVIIFG